MAQTPVCRVCRLILCCSPRESPQQKEENPLFTIVLRFFGLLRSVKFEELQDCICAVPAAPLSAWRDFSLANPTMARLTRSRRTAAKSEASEAASDTETAPPAEKRTRRSRRQETKAAKEPVPPPPAPIEEEPQAVEEQKTEPEPVPQEEEAVPVQETTDSQVTEARPKKIEVEEEKLDFEVEDELQLKAQKDADIDGDTDEASKDQTSPPAAEAGEEKLTALDDLLKKRMSRRQSSAVDKENRKDRWGKLVEKVPVNDSRTQVVVTTDSLKELSAELQKEQSRKKSVDEGVSKDQPQSAAEAKAPDDSPERTEEDKVRDDPEKKNKEDELNMKRKARHISMGDDSSSKSTPTDSASKPIADTRKVPTAGLSLGTTNWEDLENHRRKPREESTPPKEQPSVHLLVNNLVRPFTLAQLTDFISHGNERVVTDLWLDKIKSKAIATFQSSEMSERAREELHNLVWPKGSPKTIKCEFLTPEQVLETKNPSEAKLSNSSVREEKKEARVEVKEETSRSRDRTENGSGKADGDDLRRTLDNHKDKDRSTEDRSTDHQRHNRQERDESPPAKKIREWDLPKIQMQRKRLKEETAPKEEPPKKEVDDSPCLETFFKKTSAMPPLYWLPLNEEQAVERAKKREAKQKEEDRQKLSQLRKNRRF